MKYRSTRGGPLVSLDEALVAGIAPDGGLFLPESLPRFDTAAFADAITPQQVGRVLLAPFFEGSTLAGELGDIVDETLSFPLPVTRLPTESGYCGLLELFHGPTAAFKDVGAGFLAACMSRLQGDEENPLTILVATSGDTGGAVAAAFDGRSGVRVAVLYPDGRVSKRQAHQLTCWSDNVLSLAVSGSFDDCQSLVKAAMADAALTEKHRFSSANSINIGRLLPQSIYYAHTALAHQRDTGNAPSFIVPTGNLGNALACFLARELGLPIGELVLATNANRLIVDFLDGQPWAPRVSLETLANAMDVGNPSNMERLRAVGGESAVLKQKLRAVAVSDDEIRAEIARVHADWQIPICPHTATAVHAWRHLPDTERSGQDWILAATAHPAKFEEIVEPIIGAEVPLPAGLAEVLQRPAACTRIEPSLERLAEALDSGFSR